MRRKSFLPPLKIFINKHHRILKLRSAHGTSNSNTWILFMSCPYFKTFSMETFLADFACWVALTVHILITDGTHGVLFERREVLGLLTVGGFSYTFELVFFGRLSSPFCVFQLDESLELWIEVWSWIVCHIPCQMMGLVGGTLNFFSSTYRVWMQWSCWTIPQEQDTFEPILT